MPPGTATTNVRSDGHQRFHIKNKTIANRRIPMHSLEPGSLNARNIVTNVCVRCWWNQVAAWVSGPANGFTMAMAAQIGGRLNEGVTKKNKIRYSSFGVGQVLMPHGPCHRASVVRRGSCFQMIAC